MSAVFASPQWKIVVAYEPCLYGVVGSTVEIAPLRGKSRYVDVVVPTELFPLLDLLLSADEKQAASERKVGLYLDQLDEKHWVFGFEIPKLRVQDLWVYTTSQLPPWAGR